MHKYTCLDCRAWCGRCVKGKKNRIARACACEDFAPKVKEPELEPCLLDDLLAYDVKPFVKA